MLFSPLTRLGVRGSVPQPLINPGRTVTVAA
jgi:hypothetical protein